MALNLSIERRVLNFTEEKKEIFVAAARRGDVISTAKIAEFVAQDTSTRPKQVEMILNSLITSIIAWVEEGHGVRLGELGSFLPSVKSIGSNNSEEVGVKRIRLIFYPSHKLRVKMEGVAYSTSNRYKVESAVGDEPSLPTGGDGLG